MQFAQEYVHYFGYSLEYSCGLLTNENNCLEFVVAVTVMCFIYSLCMACSQPYNIALFDRLIDNVYLFFLIFFFGQALELKSERRSSTQQCRKNKRLSGVCLRRWSQDFWIDSDDYVDTGKEYQIEPQNAYEAVFERLENLVAARVSIDVVIDEVIPTVMLLYTKLLRVPHSVLGMLNQVALNGNQHHLEKVFESGIINVLIDHLATMNQKDFDQTITLLGNMTKTAIEFWQRHIPYMGIPTLLHWLNRSVDDENMQAIVRLLGDIFMNAPTEPKWFWEFLTVSKPFIRDMQWPNVTEECLSTLYRLTASNTLGRDERIEQMVNLGIFDVCADIMRTGAEEEIIEAALKVIQNISAARIYNSVIVESGLLADIKSLLFVSHTAIQKATISVVSNIVMGNEAHFGDVVAASLLADTIAQSEIVGYGAQQMIVEMISTIVQRDNTDHIQYLIEQTAAIDTLCSTLDHPDATMNYVSTYLSYNI